jgi:hypothetical protein
VEARWCTSAAKTRENSPEVIHRRYHGCIDGYEEAANEKIARALSEEGDNT